jgi:magnesium transporter
MLINCVVYQDGKKLPDITIEEISDFVCKPDCFVWVALQDAEPHELAKMQEEFSLHELAVEDALHGHQRPKIEEYGNSLFCVLHTVELLGDQFILGEVGIFAGKNFILSVRSGTRQGFRNVRDRCEQEPHFLKQGSGFVFYALMDTVVDRYFPVIDALEIELEQIEEQIFNSNADHSNIQSLYDLKRKVLLLRHAVVPLMEALGKLYGGRVPELCAASQDYFRDVHDHLYRINTTLDHISDTISTAIQANLSLVAIEESKVTKRLAAWAAIFAVATAFAGIWGMNFNFMPELEWKYGYPAALVLLTVVCGYLYYRFKKSKWL